MKIASIGATGGMEIGPRLESPLCPLLRGYMVKSREDLLALVSVSSWMIRPSSPKKTV